MRMGGGHGMHIGHVGGGARIGGIGFRRIGGGVFRHPGLRRPPIFAHGHHHHHHWRWWGWRRHYWYPPVIATGVATGVVAAAPSYNRCTCLTKEYTPEGAVLFKDVCTNEAAINPPAAAAQPGSYDPAQDPSAQTALQPQLQARPVLPQLR
jgi:hypothetical protein